VVGGGGGVLKVAWFSLKEVSLPPLLEGRETPKPKFGGKMSEKIWSLFKEFITGSCRYCGGNSRERNHQNGCF